MSQTRWQYRTETLKTNAFSTAEKNAQRINDQLNKLGAQGWELVNVSHDSMRYRAFFKKAL